MSSNLMQTEAGGEQTQYEATAESIRPHKKSGGQLGDKETTTDPSNTEAQSQQNAERGAKTAENIRYGQTISESGMGGMTTTNDGDASDKDGFGRVEDKAEEIDGDAGRAAQGYGEGSGVGG